MAADELLKEVPERLIELKQEAAQMEEQVAAAEARAMDAQPAVSAVEQERDELRQALDTAQAANPAIDMMDDPPSHQLASWRAPRRRRSSRRQTSRRAPPAAGHRQRR